MEQLRQSIVCRLANRVLPRQLRGRRVEERLYRSRLDHVRPVPPRDDVELIWVGARDQLRRGMWELLRAQTGRIGSMLWARRLARGQVVIGFAACDGRWVHYSILNLRGRIVESAGLPSRDAAVVGPCFTAPEARGRGIYPHVISAARLELRRRGARWAYIFASAANAASLRGIEKAGYEYVCPYVRARRPLQRFRAVTLVPPPDLPDVRPLADVRVNVVSTGHSANDHRVLDKTARTLSRAGADVCVIARRDEADDVQDSDGVRFHALPPSPGRLDRFLAAPWRALEACLARPADVVHIHDAELLLICPLLKLFGRCAVFYDVHEDFGLLMLRREWIPRWLRRPVRYLLTGIERLLALSADGIVAVTEALADKFWNRNRVGVYNLPAMGMVSHALDRSLPVQQRRYDVVHLGVLTHQRLDFLGDVLRDLAERRSDFSALLIGLAPEQIDWCREHLPAVDVEPMGKVPYDRVPALVGNCRVGINVHPWIQPHLQVALPVKFFEYMACGCSIVSSALPELVRLLDDDTRSAVELIEGPAVDAFVSAIDSLLADRERLAANRVLFRRKVTDVYNWQTQAGKLLAIYARVLTRRPAQRN